MDSCLDCRAHEVTLPTLNREVFWLQHPWCEGEHYHGEWVAQPRATEFSSFAFSCKGFAPSAVVIYSHVVRRSSSRASATSFTLLSSVYVLGLPCLGSLFMLTQPPWKRLAQRETALRPTVNTPQTSFKAPWIPLGLTCDLWSEIVTVPTHLQAPFLALVKEI